MPFSGFCMDDIGDLLVIEGSIIYAISMNVTMHCVNFSFAFTHSTVQGINTYTADHPKHMSEVFE